MRSPAHQENAESCQQEGDEEPRPHVCGEGRQQAEGALLGVAGFVCDEAQARVDEGRRHVHVTLPGRCDSQGGHSQVCFLGGGKIQI